MSVAADALFYAVRPRVLLKYFGQLCFVIAALTLVPLLFSLFSREFSVSVRYAAVLGVLLVTAVILSRLRAPSYIQPNEALVLTAGLFVFTPLLMAFPMMASGIGFLDAFFEAVSGATTTGLSTLPGVEDAPASFLFSRSWMQWYGGLGIVIFSLALLVPHGLAAKRLGVSDAETEDLVGSTKAHARRIIVIYGALTALGVLLLLLLGGGIFNSIVYTFAAVSTGGYAPHDNSLAGLGGWPIQIAVTLIALAGSIPLIIYHRAYRHKRRGSVTHLQTRSILIAGLIVSIFLAVSMIFSQNRPVADALFSAPLTAFSAQSTAGFSSLDVSALNPESKLILIVSMMTGGGSGSTAGGFKILRLLIFFSLVKLFVRRACLSRRAVDIPRLEGRRLGDEEIKEALLIILLYIAVIGLSWLIFLAMGYPALNSLFEVASATGTVGLSAGITGPDLPRLLKGVLCVDMLLGRLEIMAWLVFLFPKTWFGKRMEGI